MSSQSHQASNKKHLHHSDNTVVFTPPGIDPSEFDPREFEPVHNTAQSDATKARVPTIDASLFKPTILAETKELGSAPPTTPGVSTALPYEEVHKNSMTIGGDIAEPAAGPDLTAMNFDERVEHLRKVVFRNPLEREIHYKTLKFCFERRTLKEIEDFIGALPEFSSAAQSQYYLLQFLLKGAGIEEYELDEHGNVVLQEQKEGLTEDEIDDLVATPAFTTNEYGRALVEQMSPRNRLFEMLETMPQHYNIFVEVLDFLTEKRSLSQVDSLLRGRDALMIGRDPSERPLQPSVFVDKLEKAAVIYWEKGWIVSEEGRELLKILKERRSS